MDSTAETSEFKYMIMVWNGKQANAMVKASAMTKGYELDDLLAKGKDSVLKVLFSGGVIRGRKLQRGSVYLFNDVINQKTDRPRENPNEPSTEQLKRAYETVYLLKWLFPPEQAFQMDLAEPTYSNFSSQFNLQSSRMRLRSGSENFQNKLGAIDHLGGNFYF